MDRYKALLLPAFLITVIASPLHGQLSVAGGGVAVRLKDPPAFGILAEYEFFSGLQGYFLSVMADGLISTLPESGALTGLASLTLTARVSIRIAGSRGFYVFMPLGLGSGAGISQQETTDGGGSPEQSPAFFIPVYGEVQLQFVIDSIWVIKAGFRGGGSYTTPPGAFLPYLSTFLTFGAALRP